MGGKEEGGCMVQLYTKINIWSIWDHGYIVERSLPSFGLLPCLPLRPCQTKTNPAILILAGKDIFKKFWREKSNIRNIFVSGFVGNISGGRNGCLEHVWREKLLNLNVLSTVIKQFFSEKDS
jgi:hypothetical protein